MHILYKLNIHTEHTPLQRVLWKKIFIFHGFPKAIISDRDAKFLENTFGIFVYTKKLKLAYHPQTYGQTGRVNQALEDMLHMYVMDKPTKWEYYLPLVEFAYNDVQQASLGMSPFEALYGRKCRTSVTWDNPMDKIVLGT